MACCTVATAAKRAARRSSSATSSVVNELHRHRTRYHARLDAFIEEKANGRASAVAVVKRPVIDIHADELIGFAAIEPTRVTHRVVERVLAVIQTISDALAQVSRNFLLHVARHVLADDVAAEGKWQACLPLPPRSHVGDEMQALILVRQLPLMDQQAGIDIAAKHRLLDLIERNDDRDEIGLV